MKFPKPKYFRGHTVTIYVQKSFEPYRGMDVMGAFEHAHQQVTRDVVYITLQTEEECREYEYVEEGYMNQVCGLVFSRDMGMVVLVEKKRPEWMAGMLNGVGGATKEGELRARTTMARKCLDETGLDVPLDDWQMLAEFVSPASKMRIVFFYTLADLPMEKPKNDEQIFFIPVGDTLPDNIVPDLSWLIPMAVARQNHRTYGPIQWDHVIAMGKPV